MWRFLKQFEFRFVGPSPLRSHSDYEPGLAWDTFKQHHLPSTSHPLKVLRTIKIVACANA